MPLAQVISPQQLANQLEAPDWIVIDCRFSLDDPTYGRRAYEEGHLPGARFADLEQDLSGPVIPGRTGRHPLPDAERLLSRLREWGLEEHSQVVLYDDGPGAFAARAWWLLVWLGKRDGLYLLDGGLRAWREAAMPLTTERPAARRGGFQGAPDERLVISSEQLATRLDAPAPLLDARALPRFRGDQEPIDPVAGHIPGARCAPFTDNLDDSGRFLSPERLAQRFTALLEGQRPSDVIAYCGSGVTACHNLFAMALAGLPLARLHAGSWSEWITDPSRPVARGD
ncbi:sulfurtransferase [Stutzerimonas urumqiensis]|uniref:sulfurtransferase n=1 Tax=Stutzerimonas urumqiensis TaxID=638269 RepID=UPI003DA63206